MGPGGQPVCGWGFHRSTGRKVGGTELDEKGEDVHQIPGSTCTHRAPERDVFHVLFFDQLDITSRVESFQLRHRVNLCVLRGTGLYTPWNNHRSGWPGSLDDQFPLDYFRESLVFCEQQAKSRLVPCLASPSFPGLAEKRKPHRQENGAQLTDSQVLKYMGMATDSQKMSKACPERNRVTAVRHGVTAVPRTFLDPLICWELGGGPYLPFFSFPRQERLAFCEPQ